MKKLFSKMAVLAATLLVSAACLAGPHWVVRKRVTYRHHGCVRIVRKKVCGFWGCHYVSRRVNRCW